MTTTMTALDRLPLPPRPPEPPEQTRPRTLERRVDDVDASGIDSFPASDAPGWWAGA